MEASLGGVVVGVVLGFSSRFCVLLVTETVQSLFDAHAGIAASHEILTDIIGIVSCNV